MVSEDWPWFQHAALRTIVLQGRQVLFTPVLKSGCTSTLWLLAGLIGYKPERFHRSGGPAVTPHMTVHNLHVWGDRHRWAKLSASEQYDISYADDWFRFSIVRDPAPRIWSAWQSKLLMQEPGFVERFGDAAWFPWQPRNADEVVELFRQFVRSMADPATRLVDAHWSPQARLLAAAPPMTHIGRVENVEATLELLAAHLGVPVEELVLPRENSSLVSYHPGVYDAETAVIVNEVYAEDYSSYGYAPLTADPDGLPDRWRGHANATLPAIHAVVDRHRRIDVLSRAANPA